MRAARQVAGSAATSTASSAALAACYGGCTGGSTSRSSYGHGGGRSECNVDDKKAALDTRISTKADTNAKGTTSTADTSTCATATYTDVDTAANADAMKTSSTVVPGSNSLANLQLSQP